MVQRAVLAFAALTLVLGGPTLAQDEAAREVQTLLLEGQDRLIAASKLRESGKTSAASALYDKACEAYAKALEAAPTLRGVAKEAIAEVIRIAHYNTACARALQGRSSDALDALAKALAAGYDDFERLERDQDLSSLREEARFVQLLERERQKILKEAQAAGRPVLSADALFPYDFKVTTLEGETIALEDLRGKIVVVDYWGTWCPPCRKEIPHFVKLKEEFGEKLVIIGMTWERGNGGEAVIGKVKRFADELKINYPLTMVTKQEDLAKVPEFEGFPTTLFLDRRGRVRARETGYRDFETLHEMLHALDDEEPAEETPEQGEDEKEGEGKKGERRIF